MFGRGLDPRPDTSNGLGGAPPPRTMFRVPQAGHTNSPAPATSSSVWHFPQRTIMASHMLSRTGPAILARSMDASVIVVGDEVLAGHVQDANSHFIATRLAHHGHRLVRVVVVADEPDRIADELQRDLASSASIIFTCGGLGPTHDDRTMEGVAHGLGVSLEPCAPLAARIEELVGHLGRAGFSDESWGAEGLRKMALAPPGAQILPCSIGVIPALLVRDPRADIVILPGPPRELQAVFGESVEPMLLAGTGAQVWREEVTHAFPESTLAAPLTTLAADHPAVSIGSYPQVDHTLIRIAGPIDEATDVATQIRAHIGELEASDDGKRLLDFFRQRRGGNG
jgi:nicotinamide-nucleotide amidase